MSTSVSFRKISTYQVTQAGVPLNATMAPQRYMITVYRYKYRRCTNFVRVSQTQTTTFTRYAFVSNQLLLLDNPEMSLPFVWWNVLSMQIRRDGALESTLLVRAVQARGKTLSWFQRHGWKANITQACQPVMTFRHLYSFRRNRALKSEVVDDDNLPLEVFLEKDPLRANFHKSFPKGFRTTPCVWISWNLASVKSCVVYLTKTKFRRALPLSLLRGSRLKSVTASSGQYAWRVPNFIQIRSRPADL